MAKNRAFYSIILTGAFNLGAQAATLPMPNLSANLGVGFSVGAVATKMSLAAVQTLSPAVAVLPQTPAMSPIDKPFSMPVKTFRLTNGLQVVVHEDHSSPAVAVSVTYRVGSQNEKPGRSGFAHLFEHLMAQGTKSIQPREISKLVESNGGVRNAYTTKTNTTYFSLIPRGALALILWAEAERMHTLNIDERALALEKQVVLEEMRLRYKNVPYNAATMEHLYAPMFERWENQHSVIGEADDIRNATLKDVREFYAAYYLPNNATLSLAGDITVDEAKALVEKHFGAIESRPLPPEPGLVEAPLKKSTVRTVEDPLAKLPLLSAAWRAPERGSKDYWALTILGEILSGKDANPLYEELVKNAKLAISAEADFPAFVRHYEARGPDLIALQAQLKTGSDGNDALARMYAVVKRFAEQGPTAEELERAKAQLELSWTKGMEFLATRGSSLGAYAAMIGDPADFFKDLQSALSTTAEDIRQAVSRWMVEPERNVLHIVPGKAGPRTPEPKSPEAPIAAPRPIGDPKPAVDAGRPITPPDIHRFTLSNGMEAVVVRDTKLPLLEMRLQFKGGKAAEAAGQGGSANAAADLMLKGANGKNGGTVAQTFSRLGYHVAVQGQTESFAISAAGLKRNGEPFFDALGKVLAQASYSQKDLDLWKETMLEQMKALRSDPKYMALQRLKGETFPGHAYSKDYPSDQEIGAMTSTQLGDFHRRLLNVDNASLVLVGDIDPEQARRMLERSLGKLASTGRAGEVPAIPEAGAARTVFVDRPGSVQANILVGTSIDIDSKHPDYMALVVMNQILGGPSTARLFVNLRVQHGYTYGAYSSLAPFSRGQLWAANTEVRNEVLRESLKELSYEIRRMSAEPVPAETLEDTRRFVAGNYMIRLATLDKTADYLAQLKRDGKDPEAEIRTYLAQLNALTPADIQRVARRYLDPEKMVTVIVGDKASLEPMLTPASN